MKTVFAEVVNSNFSSINNFSFGYFLTTVILLSPTKTLWVISTLLSGTIKYVGCSPLVCVPSALLGMCIFLGSESLSVHSKKSSIIFIPVIKLLQLKFNNLFLENNK